MARTKLFARMRRAMIEARRIQALSFAPRAVTRREALILAGAAAAAACAPHRGAGREVVIIGAGVAGLTAAYRLAQAGRRPVVYEASARYGGRMFTRRDFAPEGQFCELGGELVDTTHESLIALAEELGVGIQRIASENEAEADLYDIGGVLRRGRDMLDPQAGTGAFLPLVAPIAADQEALLDADGEWTQRARELDRTSLSDYLAALRPLTEDWAVDLIDLAYMGEYGQPTARQSALNLVDLIGVEAEEDFAVFGDSDEANRIAGGSSALIEALISALHGRAEFRTRHELKRMSADEAGVSFAFDAPGETVEVRAGRAVIAMPFTRLRAVEGVGDLGLSAAKREAIMTLGYGNNAKLMVATRARPWSDAASGAPQFHGALYSDRGFQCVWETSRGQDGEGGVLTNFMAASRAELDEETLVATLAEGLGALSPTLAGALDPDTRVSFFWARYPHSLGSYASPAPGQYTTLLEAASAPELGGRLHFAGEHTNPEFLGFMNGAVASGERAAAEILAG